MIFVLGNLLGPAGEFDLLLQAEPMRQEEEVARVLTRSRRRWLGERVGSPEDRTFFQQYVEAGLQHFTQGHYREAVASLVQAASRAVRSFVQEERGGPDIRVERKVRGLLETHASLRTNFGFLQSLSSPRRPGPLPLEEALLGVFAFQQVIEALIPLSQDGKGRT